MNEGADGTRDGRSKKKRTRLIVAAGVGAMVLLVALLPVPSILLRRRERAAARHVKSLGGKCEWKQEPPSWLFSPLAPLLGKLYAKLHSERLRFIGLNGSKVTDADLVHLKGLTGLQALSLKYTQVTDAGLVHLKGLTGLEWLTLYGSTQVTDAGLVHFKDLTGLQWLSLSCTRVTGSGFAHLEGLTGLRQLYLTNGRVTDAGLAHLKGLTGLQRLILHNNTQITGSGFAHLKSLTALKVVVLGRTQVTDAGLVHFKGLAGLRSLSLGGTQVTDAGLVHVKGSTGLEGLGLGGTQVTDAGLVHFKGLTGLRSLILNETQVTDAGVAELKAALPRVEVGREQRAEVERCGSYLRALGYISYGFGGEVPRRFPTDPAYFWPDAHHLLVVEGMDDAVEFTDADLPPGAKDATGFLGPEHTHYGLVSNLVYPDDFGRVYMFCKTSHPGGKRNVLGVSAGSYFDTVSEEELDRLLETTLREARAAGRNAKVWGTPSTPEEHPGRWFSEQKARRAAEERAAQERQRRHPEMVARLAAEDRSHVKQALLALSRDLPPTLTLDLGGGVTMELVLIPAGEFLMGNPKWDGRLRDMTDGPVHRVRITRPFYMGKYEVTQAQYERIMGANPSSIKGANYPVERMSWFGATEFCRKLSELTGKTVRLPTEAEWEYACRAGTTTRYFFGDGLDDGKSLDDYAWHCKNSERDLNPVGTKRANPWGLHDMYGNVCEWCSDWFDSGYYAKSPEEDPQGPASMPTHALWGYSRVLRGNVWGGHPTSAVRYRCPPAIREFGGFRVVAAAPGE